MEEYNSDGLYIDPNTTSNITKSELKLNENKIHKSLLETIHDNDNFNDQHKDYKNENSYINYNLTLKDIHETLFYLIKYLESKEQLNDFKDFIDSYKTMEKINNN
jgi:hypothetical protein